MQTLQRGTLNKITLSAGVEGFCFPQGHGDTDEKYLKYYIFVAVFGEVRAVCLDGFSDHCIFESPY